MHQENQFIRPYYIHRTKEKVFMQHNKVSVNGKMFEVDQGHLLIDLQLPEKHGQLKLLKLYDDGINDLKLIRYHVNKSSKTAIFVFL